VPGDIRQAGIEYQKCCINPTVAILEKGMKPAPSAIPSIPAAEGDRSSQINDVGNFECYRYLVWEMPRRLAQL
jgi:hypothetical protein